ncbi:MAG TPA: SRPBCC family protein [Polyangiaceae bacterium]|nr:SRPBCC family protein [Polyangiaceae bacterium]
MLKRVAAIAIALIAVLVLVVATRSSHMHVERSAIVPVAPDVVFPLINDFHAWSSWSPWEKLDPEMKREFSGAPQGKGAQYAWSGNDQVGVGNMQITDNKPAEQVTIQLEFKEPWAATNVTNFRLAAVPEGTKVTWAMDGENNFAAKAMSLVMDMDQLIGKDFEAGLANLGAVAQASAETRAAAQPVAPAVIGAP